MTGSKLKFVALTVILTLVDLIALRRALPIAVTDSVRTAESQSLYPNPNPDPNSDPDPDPGTVTNR